MSPIINYRQGAVCLLLCVSLIFLEAGLVWGNEGVPHRKLEDYNWMEFKKTVPSKVDTVLLVTGTLEAHGVGYNGADFTVPYHFCQLIGEEVNGIIAPYIPYGRTVSLAPYPGGFGISEEVFKGYVKEVIEGLAAMGFKNIIIINGHGPNRQPTDEAATEVALARNVRCLVIDWWSYTADITKEVFGEDGGHAGVNENAAMLAVAPSLIHKELYSKGLTSPLDSSYTAIPSPSTILLYKAGEGYPNFDLHQAELYLNKVAEKLAKLIKDTIRRWDEASF